ncbi:Jacalin-like lectin domain-containing protein [Micromonospora nigra]|uniref:Jacalin-like lectin domain-containing protein n=1 Tax=Micromonospora nigra TaxID=145857 RepID=A0A1C6REN8_9ACTN|nr:jacalin-like lectin [Micromonospora nigra]SCL15619.1 Jacalin-like lectin domain-containing protein [Micromonospora nigra]
MNPVRLLASAALVAALLPVAGPASAAAPAPAPAAASGAFSVLTYNVAGLPEPLSGGNPAVNTRPIGERVNAYDIVNVQEDFNYHADLYETDMHPHRTPTSGGVPFGDGLNTMSAYPSSGFTRVRWDRCNGTDCLTPKGFTYARVRLAEGVFVDLYNAHTNAGSTDADLAARRANISQLSRYVATNSTGNAVIVMGDLNARYTRAGDNVRELLTANGLTDAWVQQERGGVPPAAGSPALVCDPAAVTDACEVVDKILYRGSRLVRLELTRYHNEHTRFLDPAGAALSDHWPHAAWFSWTRDPGLRASDTWGGPHGTPFTDADLVGSPVTSVTLRAGSRLDAVGVGLADGTRSTHGGTGGTPATLTLAPDEHVTQVTLTQGQRNGRTRIFSARLTTNLGRTLTGGTPTADAVTFTAPPGGRLAGLFGRCGDEVDQLGVIWAVSPGD